MPAALPDDVTPYKSTPVFDATSVPKGLLAEHRTKAGTWGRLEVHSGSLTLRFADEDVLCDPEHPGIIPPTVPHEVVLSGPVRFCVVFLRAADAS